MEYTTIHIRTNGELVKVDAPRDISCPIRGCEGLLKVVGERFQKGTDGEVAHIFQCLSNQNHRFFVPQSVPEVTRWHRMR